MRREREKKIHKKREREETSTTCHNNQSSFPSFETYGDDWGIHRKPPSSRRPPTAAQCQVHPGDLTAGRLSLDAFKEAEHEANLGTVQLRRF